MWYEIVVAQCDRDMQIWLLYLADHPHRVGIGKTSDYNTQLGPALAYARKLGVSSFDARSGFKRLTRKEFASPRGTMPILLEDKPDLMRLTKLGIGVLQYLGTNVTWREGVLKGVGANVAVTVWWFPVTIKEDAPVRLATSSPKVATEPFTIQVRAEFRCGRCETLVTHDYSMKWREEEWEKVAVACGKCGTIWEHWKGYPYAKAQAANE